MPTNINKIDNLWYSLSKYSENKYITRINMND